MSDSFFDKAKLFAGMLYLVLAVISIAWFMGLLFFGSLFGLENTYFNQLILFAAFTAFSQSGIKYLEEC